MIKVDTFVNTLDGKTLQRVYSDSGFYVKETATGFEYEYAVVPLTRSASEFEETERKNTQEEQPDLPPEE